MQVKSYCTEIAQPTRYFGKNHFRNQGQLLEGNNIAMIGSRFHQGKLIIAETLLRYMELNLKIIVFHHLKLLTVSVNRFRNREKTVRTCAVGIVHSQSTSVNFLRILLCSVNPSMLWCQCRSTGNKWYSPHTTQNRPIIMRLRRHLPRMSCSYNEALHNQHLGWSIVHLIKIIVPDSRLYSSILHHRSLFYLNQLNWMKQKIFLNKASFIRFNKVQSLLLNTRPFAHSITFKISAISGSI